MTQRSAFARRPLAAALFVALIAPGMAFAQTAKEKALEARVADRTARLDEARRVAEDATASKTRFLAAAGIPSYGPPGLFGNPDGNGVHGLNERITTRAVFTGRDLLTDLVIAYAF